MGSGTLLGEALSRVNFRFGWVKFLTYLVLCVGGVWVCDLLRVSHRGSKASTLRDVEVFLIEMSDNLVCPRTRFQRITCHIGRNQLCRYSTMTDYIHRIPSEESLCRETSWHRITF